MTPDSFRETLAGLGLSQARLGRLLGVDKMTPSRWATGDAPIPRAVELLLWAMAEGGVTLAELEAVGL